MRRRRRFGVLRNFVSAFLHRIFVVEWYNKPAALTVANEFWNCNKRELLSSTTTGPRKLRAGVTTNPVFAWSGWAALAACLMISHALGPSILSLMPWSVAFACLHSMLIIWITLMMAFTAWIFDLLFIGLGRPVSSWSDVGGRAKAQITSKPTSQKHSILDMMGYRHTWTLAWPPTFMNPSPPPTR
jgi:hypothetical protein